MSYERIGSYEAPGGVLDYASQAFSAAAPILGLAADVAEDPALPTVIAKAKTLIACRTKTASTVKTSTGAQAPGIGLSSYVTPLDLLIYDCQYPWARYVAIGALIGVPFLVGYLVAK